jgi:hypothetical protein
MVTRSMRMTGIGRSEPVVSRIEKDKKRFSNQTALRLRGVVTSIRREPQQVCSLRL